METPETSANAQTLLGSSGSGGYQRKFTPFKKDAPHPYPHPRWLVRTPLHCRGDPHLFSRRATLCPGAGPGLVRGDHPGRPNVPQQLT